MNKLLKILLLAVALLFVYLGATSIYKSMSKKDGDSSSIVVDGEEEYDIFQDDGEDEDDFFKKDGDSNIDTSATSSGIDYSEIDEALEEPIKEDKTASPPAKKPTPTKNDAPRRIQKPKSSTQTNTSVSKPQATSSNEGKYLVIAGSYLVKENADKMRSKLKKLGYDQAEIVVFDERKYHTVCATKSNNYDTAVRQSNALKRKGVDSYVHTKQ